jgi:hypothetical protein
MVLGVASRPAYDGGVMALEILGQHVGLINLIPPTSPRKQPRLLFPPRAAAYGTGMQLGLGLVWCICWVTSVGILLHARWGCDLAQGAALIVLLFGYSMLGYGVLRWWWHDLKSRCPCCLRLLGMTQHRGKAQDVLLEPVEIESVCLYGHGQAKESRWRQEFECDTSAYF